MTEPVKKFWMVHGVGQGAPRYCHATKEGARIEAARLAKNNPGVTFVVLAAIAAFHADRPEVNEVKIAKPATVTSADDHIPF